MITCKVIGATRDAWGYLLSTVASEQDMDSRNRLDYYMKGGTPAGVWVGSAAVTLGVAGKEAEDEHLSLLFGEGKHPLTGDQLGSKFQIPDGLQERFQSALSTRLAKEGIPASEAEYRQLESEVYMQVLEQKVQQSVSGFELVFSPPKSVSSWWALADPDLKTEIQQAHKAAVDATIEKLETDIVRTRIGVNGIAQETVKGIVAATFDHWESREGDPQLHTHMLLANRVEGEDGKWRTIDSRYALLPGISVAGAYYDSALMDELSARFGVDWTVPEIENDPARYQQYLQEHQVRDSEITRHQFALDLGVTTQSVRWQIRGVPNKLNDLFSKRSHKIRLKKEQIVAKFRKKHGREPTTKEIIGIRQWATIATRQRKVATTLQQLTQSWRQQASHLVGDTFQFAEHIRDGALTSIGEHKDWALISFRADDLTYEHICRYAQLALHTLTEQRAVWTRRHAEKVILDFLQSVRFRSARDRDQVVKQIVEEAVQGAVALSAENELYTPRKFRTKDGGSKFRPRLRELFTTAQVWDAEERLLEASRSSRVELAVSAQQVAEIVAAPTQEGIMLSEDQAAAVTAIATSGRKIDLLVGPAGAGKTTSLQKLLEIWQHVHGENSVRGLAPTARAAEVLAESLGIQTENTAKWRVETSRGTKVREGINYELQAGELLIVDEASIAGTLALDMLREQAEKAGAKLLLVGDWAQLSSVEAGGAFGLLAQEREDVPELNQLHRFRESWEAEASRMLRLGKTSAIDHYHAHDRIKWAGIEDIQEMLVEAWRADEAKGYVSLMVASTNSEVQELNMLARDIRVAEGLVDTDTVLETSAGESISAGDRIVTRQNARTLRTNFDRWVRNNDEWEVIKIHADGGILAAAGEEQVLLPAGYVAEHVQLGYATTAHRSQGRTVDTCHAIIDESATRNTTYVALTRGKRGNHAYVPIEIDPTGKAVHKTWREIFESTLKTTASEQAAHQVKKDELERVSSLRQLSNEYQTMLAAAVEEDYRPILAEFGLVDENTDSPMLGAVLAGLRRAVGDGELADQQDKVRHLTARLLDKREMQTARHDLAVFHYRLNKYLGDVEEIGGMKSASKPSERMLICGIIERVERVHDPDIARGLWEREQAMWTRIDLLVDTAIENQEPWIMQLGQPAPGEENRWRARAATIAAYRDYYEVDDDINPLGSEFTHNRTRQRAYEHAREALYGERFTAEWGKTTGYIPPVKPALTPGFTM